MIAASKYVYYVISAAYRFNYPNIESLASMNMKVLPEIASKFYSTAMFIAISIESM